MKNFNNDDFGDFFENWEHLNNMSNNNNRAFKNEMVELLRRMMDTKQDNFDFRIIPINNKDIRNFDSFIVPDSELKTEKGVDKDGVWESKRWESPDGSWSYTSIIRSSTPDDFFKRSRRSTSETPTKEAQDRIKEVKLARLQKTLDLHVEREEYEKAAELKKIMDEIK